MSSPDALAAQMSAYHGDDADEPLANALTLVFRGSSQTIAFAPGTCVRDIRAQQAAQFELNPASLSYTLAAAAGSCARALADDCELASLPRGAVVNISESTSLRDVAVGAAALVADYAPAAIFIAAVPFVLYLGLSRRGAPLFALRDVLRLPFSD